MVTSVSVTTHVMVESNEDERLPFNAALYTPHSQWHLNIPLSNTDQAQYSEASMYAYLGNEHCK
jgi:hypothetical protein